MQQLTPITAVPKHKDANWTKHVISAKQYTYMFVIKQYSKLLLNSTED